MGCDIHIAIQCQEPDGQWVNVPWQHVWTFKGADSAIEGIPVAPDVFRARNYDLFAILANVRNGVGFAGIKMGEGWPSIADGRGWPEGFSVDSIGPDPRYPEVRDLGDHSFTWVSLDELKAFPWDQTSSTLYGVVSADEYEKLTALNAKPQSYSGGISGPGIVTYEPSTYRLAVAVGTLALRPHVRMSWEETAREATNDWPGKVLPWLDELAAGRPLRLVMGFDS